MHFIIMFILAICLCVDAQANITLSKNRLFFDAHDRADAVQLRNAGTQAMQYRTELSLIEMTEQGTLIKVDALDNSAVSMLKFSPKRGIVPAGGKQVLRFSIRRPTNLPDGEYRAVLSIASTLASDQPEAVTLKSTLSYNMPVIVRHGNTDATTTLLNPRLIYSGNVPHIELWQTRTGNRSLYGNYKITNQSGDVVGELVGVAVYTPLPQRKVLIPLTQEIQNETLNISFQEVIKFGGSQQAQISIKL